MVWPLADKVLRSQINFSNNPTLETEMNILIVGSGAAGGLIGARLIEQKCDVTFLVRPERKAQLMTTGLVLYSHFGKFRRPVSAITLDELKGFYDLIIVAVRATDYESVLQSITPSIGSQAYCQKGRAMDSTQFR